MTVFTGYDHEISYTTTCCTSPTNTAGESGIAKLALWCQVPTSSCEGEDFERFLVNCGCGDFPGSIGLSHSRHACVPYFVKWQLLT